MNHILINSIFIGIQIIAVYTFGQKQLLASSHIHKLNRLSKMPGAKLDEITARIKELKSANYKLELIGHFTLIVIAIAHFIILCLNYYQRFKFWYVILIIWGVAALFLRIVFWMKGATVISHIKVDNEDFDPLF
ncbi:MAG: hypothetical protein ACI857_003236 [Arenicella sp.]|jgi:hypothetical protein